MLCFLDYDTLIKFFIGVSCFSDASVLRGLSRSFAPLYFTVREVNEVMATEQPCDVAYEFGSGLLDIQEYPQGFPNPGYIL